jgi:hypothetical protein
MFGFGPLELLAMLAICLLSIGLPVAVLVAVVLAMQKRRP